MTEILQIYNKVLYFTQVVMNDNHCGCISVLLGYAMFFWSAYPYQDYLHQEPQKKASK
jgi:hypothetical protein